MWDSPRELRSTGSLRLERSHHRRLNNSSRQHWLFWSELWRRFIDVQLRAECGVEDALYFVDRQGFSHTDYF